ncbi:TetR/AcrR family transcriptional regulator [Herbaspirillum robiniae]|uniref:TetR/AcrR family transcriptional regulator n=1 Tax=Herbaspirillum robiniae TaxID=2014887 RepID=A0ABX2M7J9_9BURK|nr:TetR/AcrR family transcriptional regulator [Herbaspirillum robiniae]NUU04227.1 TetR/AcrR family transcriptional regulator [Herbaspirillum robiniae]
MARPREFDRDEALDRATEIFWDRGYAATSTDDLRDAMGIGRQSLYNAFGGKRQLYMEVLARYQVNSVEAHLQRLQKPESALEGIRALLRGLAAGDDRVRSMGCFGVGAVAEFGSKDSELSDMSAKTRTLLMQRLEGRLREGQRQGEIKPDLDAGELARFVMLSMTGLQVAARAGADVQGMHQMADFAVALIKSD